VNIPGYLLGASDETKKENHLINDEGFFYISIREKLNKSMSVYRFRRPCPTTRCDIPQVHFMA